MGRVRLATAWLGGCSGCHMSFLDMDEFLIDLAGMVDLVYSPLVDTKEYPENVDLALVEGAVANEGNLEMIRRIRANTKVLVSFGDCAVTGNVTAMRNPLGGADHVLVRSYGVDGKLDHPVPQVPGSVPRLLDLVRPIHAVVPVDHYLPGCPPPADRIRKLIEALLAGETPRPTPSDIKFG